MRFGVHLPLLDWDGAPFSLDRLTAVARAAEEHGLDTISANDHFVYRRPWLDGPTALAAVMSSAPTVDLMTSVALPVVRSPVALAKSLAAIDLLSGGRLIAGLGPGSTARDYEVVGIPFKERWGRLDEAVQAMRAMWTESADPFVGRYYDTSGIVLEPRPMTQGGPPIWIGSWGSEAGLRRVARLADGWLASAYNTTPERFASGRQRLGELLRAGDRDPTGFPNALVTMWLFVTDDERERRDVVERLAAMLKRPVEDIEGKLPIGPPELCSEIVARYREVGVERIVFWPLGDEVRQIERIARDVLVGE